MKIRSIDVDLVVQLRERPLVNPHTSGAETCAVCCRISTDSGLVGTAYGWAIGRHRGVMIAETLRRVAELLIDEEALRIAAIWEKFLRYSNFFGRAGLSTIAMSIMDVALWDLRCRHDGLPLWIALGGHKDAAPVYTSELMDADPAGLTPPGEMVEAARQCMERTSSTMKVRMGLRSPDEDVGRLVAIQAEVGDKARWLVDIAQRWNVSESLRAAPGLDECRLRWIEDPAAYDDLPGIVRVANELRTPVCTGENLYGAREAQEVIDTGAVRVLMLDLQRCGGISGWVKIAAQAAAKNIEVTPHVYPDIGPQLVAGTANATIAEYMPWWDFVMREPVHVDAGRVTASDQPGIGCELDPDALARAELSMTVR